VSAANLAFVELTFQGYAKVQLEVLAHFNEKRKPCKDRPATILALTLCSHHTISVAIGHCRPVN